MKKERQLFMAFCAAFLVLAGAACSKDDAAAVPESQGSGTTKVAIREVLTVQLDTVGTLAEKIGDESSTVQKLVISGPINAVDVRTIRSLPELLSLDLKEAILCGGDSTYSSFYGEHKLYDNEIGDRMFYGLQLGEIILPDSLVAIGEYAFYSLYGIDGFYFTNIVIPEGVEVIRENAFESCSYLTNVSLPSSLKSIEQAAFGSCRDLAAISLPEGLVSLGQRCFGNCRNLRSITIPKGIQVIEQSTFEGCDALSDVVFSEGLKIIRYWAFRYSGVKVVKFPDTLEKLEEEAFYHSDVETLILSGSYLEMESECFRGCTQLDSVLWAGPMTAVPNGMFMGCSSLKSILLPEPIEDIGNNAFDGCTSLETIEFPATLRRIGTTGGDTFRSCRSLKTIVLPEHFESMTSAFEGCSSLESVIMPSCERIGTNAFNECSSLSDIVLPDNLEELGNSVFANCASLRTVTIPQSVKTVDSHLFYNSHPDALFWNTSIAIPDDLFDANSNTTSPNYNMLLYLADGSTQVNAPEIRNIIVNGMADALILTGSENGTLYVPQPFKAMKCTYTQDFSYPTYPGASAGWEGISLPFTVEEITVDDGRVLAPFNANVPDAKPFWLRRLTAEGFEDVTQIEAYTPYIIAMPNNAAYDAEYNITGSVTFTAQDGAGIDIPATADMELVRDVGPDFALSCNFTYYPQNSPVYVLNRVDGENYYAGSRFVRNERAAYPFEACISSSALGIAPAYFPVDGGRPGTRTAKKALGPVPQVDDM